MNIMVMLLRFKKEIPGEGHEITVKASDAGPHVLVRYGVRPDGLRLPSFQQHSFALRELRLCETDPEETVRARILPPLKAFIESQRNDG